MFTIRDALVTGLNELEARCLGNRQLIEVGLAQGFVAMILGTTWYERAIKPGPDPDPWMLNGDDAWFAANPVPDDVGSIVYASRVVRLADALFTLAGSSGVTGLGILRRRFQTRSDTRASFMEAEIASMLVHNGCSVTVVAESGIRGRDFDFLCDASGVQVSVEVTRMCGSDLSVNSVRNKLHEKRDQVPGDRPGVLYLHVPAVWMKDFTAATAIFTRGIYEFVQWSGRFSAIILVWEDVVPFLNGGWPTMCMRAAYSNRSRFRLPNPDVFTLTADETGQVRCADSLFDRVRAYRERQRLSVAAE